MLVKNLLDKILEGKDITKAEAMQLADLDTQELPQLFEAATEIRKKFCGNKVDICSIINVKSGACSEDCKYCAQSAHYNTEIEVYPLLDADRVIERAKVLEKEGAKRFSLVASGKGVTDRDFEKVLNIYSRLKQETNLRLCASLGIIGSDKLKKLKEAGIERYHHNIEASKRFFSQICTTHTYEDRIDTIKLVQEAGLEICSGGIISMGESFEDRIDMVFELKSLNIKSIPINILNPVTGTPLENQEMLEIAEILKTVAIIRFILPDAFLRYAGGREKAMGENEKAAYLAGMNAVLVGSYLTSSGKTVEQDLNILREMGFEL